MNCYQCDREVLELSNRSRCIKCETGRGDFNEKENDKLHESIGEFRDSEKQMSDAYLRLREILGAFDTPHAPSPAQVWEHTESKARKLTDQSAMLTAFRHAANSIGVECGITDAHVAHDMAAKSVCGDSYFLQIIAEAEYRLSKMSLKYEKLRAAAEHMVDTVDEDLGVPSDTYKVAVNFRRILES